jgi:hypothetical protein
VLASVAEAAAAAEAAVAGGAVPSVAAMPVAFNAISTSAAMATLALREILPVRKDAIRELTSGAGRRELNWHPS